MYETMWVSDQRKNLICVDSYQDGIPQGRFYDQEYGCIPFKSLSQFLLFMEQVLDHKHLPQAYTEHRTFACRPDLEYAEPATSIRRGSLATFDIKVMFRQNTSWQGSLHWREKSMEHSFRSVLEMVVLMDSALRGG